MSFSNGSRRAGSHSACLDWRWPNKRSFAARKLMPGLPGWNPAVNGAGRIDGVAKVTGTKLYASDFRAADLPGWPAQTSHALLVRAPDATHVYIGMDLARPTGVMKPSVVVDRR